MTVAKDHLGRIVRAIYIKDHLGRVVGVNIHCVNAMTVSWDSFQDGTEVIYKGNTYKAYKSLYTENAFKLVGDKGNEVADINEIRIAYPQDHKTVKNLTSDFAESTELEARKAINNISKSLEEALDNAYSSLVGEPK